MDQPTLLTRQRELTQSQAQQVSAMKQYAATLNEMATALETMPERTRFDNAPDIYTFGQTALMNKPEAFDWNTFPSREAIALALDTWMRGNVELKQIDVDLNRLDNR